MATTREQELVDLEKKFWQALVENDVETATGLAHDPCILTGAQGVSTIDRKTFAEMMRSATYQLHSYSLQGEPAVRFLGDDVAIVAYQVREEMTVEGKPLTLEASDASTWVRRDGRWLCALHTESLSGDPFGRDRKRAG